MADTLKDLGEFGVIDLFRRGSFPAGEGIHAGIGDDCAVLDGPPGERLLVTTDMLLEGSHFLKEGTGPYLLGWKSLAVNLSDVAAMGGKPWAAFLAMGLPENLSSSYLEGFRKGLSDCAARYHLPLVGGDTTASRGGVSLCLTVLGRITAGSEVYRSGASPGDKIFLGRPTGESAAGLALVLDPQIPLSEPDREALLLAHNKPAPQVELGLLLSGKGLATAMIDVSDGLLQDLGHICRESGAGARLEAKRIPVTPLLSRFAAAAGRDPLDLALAGGEDYCLLFCVSPEKEEEARDTAREELSLELHPIGTITGGGGVLLGRGGKWEKWERGGWDHFAP